MVIFVTILFEHITHRLQNYCQSEASDLNAKLFQELLQKLHSELMILGGGLHSAPACSAGLTPCCQSTCLPRYCLAGFISFTVMMLLESHVLDHGSHWVVGFEFAHIALFFIVRDSSPSSIPNLRYCSPVAGLNLHRASHGADVDHDEGKNVGVPGQREGVFSSDLKAVGAQLVRDRHALCRSRVPDLATSLHPRLQAPRNL